MRLALCAALLAGCNWVLGLDELHPSTPGIDAAPIDAMVCIGRNGTMPGGEGLFPQQCVSNPANLILPTTIDTDSYQGCVVMPQAGPEPTPVCMLISGSFNIDMLHVIGRRPLVLVAATSIDIGDMLDASGGNGNDLSGWDGCPEDLDGGQGGGGGGGSFGGRGGSGGASVGGGASMTASPPVAKPTIVRQGCVGGKGGDTSVQGGAGGLAGGAIYLMAGQSISIRGAIDVSGGGGAGGPGAQGQVGGGAGGGASGGLVGLDAPKIEVFATGVVLANGGGGGGGGTSAMVPGTNGGNPSPTTPLAAAPGGAASSGAGAGGAGAVGTTSMGAPGGGGTSGGGGGGGGGVGWIFAFAPPGEVLIAGRVSPPLMQP